MARDDEMRVVPIEPIINDIAEQLAASISALGFPVGLGVAPPQEMCLAAARGIHALYGKALADAPYASPAGQQAGREEIARLEFLAQAMEQSRAGIPQDLQVMAHDCATHAADIRAVLALTTAPAMGELVAWRCFHCDETFTEERCARLHFGSSEDQSPACQIKGAEGGLLEALRRAEKDAGDAMFAIHNESTEAAKAYYAQQTRHREQLTAIEQIGYDKGIADAKAHPESIGLYTHPTTASEDDRLRMAVEAITAEINAPLTGPTHGAWDRGRIAGLKEALAALANAAKGGAK